MIKRIKRKDGHIQRYHVKAKPRMIKITLNRYKNVYILDDDDKDFKVIKGTKKLFRKHPELYGYILLFEEFQNNIGITDDGYLPKNMNINITMPLSHYQLLHDLGVIKYVTDSTGKKYYRILYEVDTNILKIPYKGKKLTGIWISGTYVKNIRISDEFFRYIINQTKKYAKFSSNKSVKDIKYFQEYKRTGGLIQFFIGGKNAA